jgi:hypothetical protein
MQVLGLAISVSLLFGYEPVAEAGMSRLMLKSGNRRRWRELYAAFAV